jgi:hypothetical protein
MFRATSQLGYFDVAMSCVVCDLSLLYSYALQLIFKNLCQFYVGGVTGKAILFYNFENVFYTPGKFVTMTN